MQVTVEHLDELAAVFRTGWDRRVLEYRAAPVLRAFDRARPGGRQEDFIDFFDGVVRQVVSGTARTSAAAVGAILWYESQIRLREDALRPLLHPDRLSQLLSHPAWPALADEWLRRYGFPATHQREMFRVGRSQAYEYLRQGKVRIAEMLNGPLMARDQVRMTEAHGWSKVIHVLHHWFEHSPDLIDHTLSAIYVLPILQRTSFTQRAAPIGSEQTLLEWLGQDRIVLIVGGAGSGKSTLLHHLGGLLLQQDQLPVWLEPGEPVASSEDLISRLIEQTGVVYSGVHQTLLLAVQSKRLQLLVDGGETWTQSQVRALLALRARLDAGLIVAARQPQHWGKVEHERVEIVWTPRALHEVMARRGQTQLWPTLIALLSNQRAMLRPWEFVQAAQVLAATFTSPVAMLEAALQAQIEAHSIAPKTLNVLLAAAWQTVTQTLVHWRPVHASDKTKANQAVEARLMVKDNEGYRFAHDLWRDFLAARYAARQLAALEVVNDLIGLADWPQILAWAIQSAWDDGRPEWASEALQALADNLAKTWHQSGWLQGAQVFVLLPPTFRETEIVQSIRTMAERALLDQILNDCLADPEFTTYDIVGEAVSEAFLALPPLSVETVDILWQRLFISRRHQWLDALTATLLHEPQLARRVLQTPLDLPQEQGAHYLAALARAPGVQPEEIIAHVRLYFPPGAEQFTVILDGLAAQGTPVAANALVSYLSDLRDDEARESSYRLEAFFKNWAGDTEPLWTQAVRLFEAGVSPLVARYFVLGLLAVDPSSATRADADQRDLVQRLSERVSHDISGEQRAVLEQLEREREIYLIQRQAATDEAAEEASMPAPRIEDIPALLQGWLDECLLENVDRLHSFPSEAIDAVLQQQTLNPAQADRLAQLGTPYAVQQLLMWSQVDPTLHMGVTYRYPARHYRAAMWPLLAEAAEHESDELRRYHLFSAIDLLWREASAWSWPVAEFFFAHCDDIDPDVATKYAQILRQKAVGRDVSAAWAGLPDEELATYARGLLRCLTTGSRVTQRLALQFLMNMPTAAVGSVLTYERLTVLLQQEPPVAQLALHYVGSHERRDLLEPLRRIADAVVTKQLEREMRQELAWALSRIGEAQDLARLLRLAQQTDTRWAALAEVLNQRRYWPTLHRAIERGEAQANWLTAILVQQQSILEVDERGRVKLRKGQNYERW